MNAPVRGAERLDLFAREDSRLQRAFVEFHEKNPHVYALLRNLAIGYLTMGHRASIGHLYECARREHFKTSGDWFKLNNNHRSRYARLLMEREPRLVGYFHTRELTG